MVYAYVKYIYICVCVQPPAKNSGSPPKLAQAPGLMLWGAWLKGNDVAML